MGAMKLSPASLGRIPENTRGILNTVFYAATAAGSAVAFLWLTNLLFHVTIERLASGSLLLFILGSLGVIGVTSLAAGVLMNRVSPEFCRKRSTAAQGRLLEGPGFRQDARRHREVRRRGAYPGGRNEPWP